MDIIASHSFCDSNTDEVDVSYMDQESEMRLIDTAKNSDRSALNQLVKKYYSRVYVFIYKRIECCPSDAEDLVQDTFIQLQKTICTFEGRSKFSTWVLGIALNIVRNYFNRSAIYKYNFVDCDELNAMASEQHENPESCASFQELLENVDNAIFLLPKKQRDAIVHSAVDGLSYRESSDRLKITESNLKSRLFRARKNLSDTVDESLF